MADDARTALIQQSERARNLASRGVMLMASNMLTLVLGFVAIVAMAGPGQLVVLVLTLLYGVVSTLAGIGCLVRGLQLDRRVGLAIHRLDHGELPQARLLR